MTHSHWRFLAITVAVAGLPAIVLAAPLGGARLISVTAVNGGCVSGPTGNSVQFWDVEPGKTYTLTIDHVTECANGGTGPTLGVRVNNSGSGNTDLVATLVAPGTYRFTYTVPAGATCTFPIFYCTTPGHASTGYFVRRGDGGSFQAHLRAATFSAGCTNPQTVAGPSCGSSTPAHPSTWGLLKTIYR